MDALFALKPLKNCASAEILRIIGRGDEKGVFIRF